LILEYRIFAFSDSDALFTAGANSDIDVGYHSQMIHFAGPPFAMDVTSIANAQVVKQSRVSDKSSTCDCYLNPPENEYSRS
jgi:hypothetical protein